ncbi:DNA adenine methylase [Chromobacterium piscinae]|uniref:DNA adenine methylase n=1 Tax=Chromobacterium piscinae TaxID=686831 RepID=UPI003F81FC13
MAKENKSRMIERDRQLKINSPALRYHGGKFRLASWVISFFPPHSCYVEPYGGAAGVLLQKERSYAEVYNDIDGDMVNFFRVLQDVELSEKLVRLLNLTPYARCEFDLSWWPSECSVERARRTIIRAQMGFGSAGATKKRTGFRIDTRREYATAMHLWLKYPESIADIGMRMQGVLVENRPALDVILQHDSSETLHFVDPPYVLGTRKLSPGSSYYRHEMSDDEHMLLLDVLADVKGMVVLSGYSSCMYENRLQNWQRFTTKSRIAANRGAGVREEVVWINSACADVLAGQIGGLFA